MAASEVGAAGGLVGEGLEAARDAGRSWGFVGGGGGCCGCGGDCGVASQCCVPNGSDEELLLTVDVVWGSKHTCCEEGDEDAWLHDWVSLSSGERVCREYDREKSYSTARFKKM